MATSKMPWFCFYVEDFGDRWHRRLSPAERCLWAAIQGAARQSPVPGVALLGEDEPMTAADLADFAALKEKEVKVGLEKLEKAGKLYQRTDGAWVVVQWDERQLDSEEQREKRAEAGALGNHERWHVRRGVTDPGCRFCAPGGSPPTPPGSPPESHSDRLAIAPGSHNGSHGESHGESHEDRTAIASGIAKQKQELEDVFLVFQQQQTAVDGEPPGHAAAGVPNALVVGHVCAAVMRSRDRFAESLTKKNPPGWLRKTWDGVRGEVIARLPDLLAAHPDWTYEQLAAAVDRKPIPAAGGATPRPAVCDRCVDSCGLILVTEVPLAYEVCDHEPLAEAS